MSEGGRTCRRGRTEAGREVGGGEEVRRGRRESRKPVCVRGKENVSKERDEGRKEAGVLGSV